MGSIVVGLTAPSHVESSRTKGQTCLLYILRGILTLYATMDVLWCFLNSAFLRYGAYLNMRIENILFMFM